MANKKNLLIGTVSTEALNRICEANEVGNNTKKYKFTGCFTQCSTPNKVVVNRNNRIYTETEMLRHLGYLRDQIKKEGYILGELDHPVDRFDTQLKYASHKITDLWYDKNSAQIKGTIELLDTPSGQLAKTLVDNGVNLAISSRACGEVNENTREVTIQQIFSYDLVYVGGFEEARLQRVMESLNNVPKTKTNFLNESVSKQKAGKALAESYGIASEGITICEMNCEAPLSENAIEKLNSKKINMKDLCKPINESDEKKEEEIKLPEANLNPLSEEDDAEEKTEDKASEDKEEKKSDDKKTLTDEEKKEKRKKIISIKTNADDEDEAKEEKRNQIVDIEGIESEEDEESESEDKDDKEEKESDDKKSKDKKEKKEDATDEAEKNPTDMETKEASDKDIEDKILNDDKDTAKDVKAQTEKDMNRFQELIKKAEKKKEVKESICKNYPFAISLSDKNFAKFAALQPKDKNKVQRYIIEKNIFDVQSINELWSTPLVEEKRQLKNWIRLASDEDKRLFAAASIEEQDAIEESSKYVLIRNKQECDAFWEKTGLRQRENARLMNESLANYNIQSAAQVQDDNRKLTDELAAKLGYSMNYLQYLEDNYID